ncbi:uncharacterized protein TrAtP1_001596 [Trichoderma atroviride]|uniref:uncharacterized protein n=1 Tax=Hypocrea atroviridis TaxID=63577 RepID=UPI00332D38DA|nr:hypothetical protein TrAtP1_001596 [Trichoderma atroviride]
MGFYRAIRHETILSWRAQCRITACYWKRAMYSTAASTYSSTLWASRGLFYMMYSVFGNHPTTALRLEIGIVALYTPEEGSSGLGYTTSSSTSSATY